MEATAPDSLIETLREMVRLDSVNSALTGRPCAEAKLCDWIEHTARGWGLKTRRLAVKDRADQLLITHEVDAGSPWLLFDSHMDTVAVDGMTVDPFGGELREGRVYGRGACDTKGTGAAMLWAMKTYAGAGGNAGTPGTPGTPGGPGGPGGGPNNIALLFGVDEEVGMFGVDSFLKNNYPTLGFVPRGVIVGEPTELHPVIAHNGLIRWKVTTHGVAAHSSVPHEGRSAISMMTRLIRAIEDRYAAGLTAEHELTGRAACSVNTIQGGSAPNIIPDSCVIDVDRRVVPGEDFKAVLPAFVGVLDAVKEEDPSLDYILDVSTTHPPLLPQGGEALLATITRVLAGLSLPTLSLGAPFATHASYYSHAGLPTVVLGPGEAHKAHTKDEYISTDQLERGAGVYLGLMRSHLG